MRAYTLVIAFAAMVAAAGCGDGGSEKPDPGLCGDGVVGGTESCDDGSANGTAGDPCNATCNFTCTTDTECGDSNTCNGTETCTNHVCKTGTAPAEGSSCGTGMVCHSSTCTSITCGDGKMDTGEECDDGAKNGTAGDACSATCHFSCKADTDCSDSNACNGAEVCTNHVCGAGTAPEEGSSCGTGKACHANECVAVRCGDGFRDGDEECDKGANNGPDTGCETTCKFSCVSTDTTRNCASADACTSQGTCDGETHVCSAGTALPDNSVCPSDPAKFCRAGACTAPVCGDSQVEPGEECDGGEGCREDCAFECGAKHPATECQGTPACQSAVCSASHTCAAVVNPALEATTCDPTHPANVCIASVCTAPPVCDKFVCAADRTCTPAADPSLNGNACDSTQPNNVCVFGACQAPACGDKVRETGEQCDDGGRLNLDGCDSDCKFEQSARVTKLDQQFATDAFCQRNALGVAFDPIIQDTLQTVNWDIPVGDGRQNIVFKFLDLTDLAGRSGTFSLGFVNATPVACSTPDCYDGHNDLDWWYVRDPATVDANEVPLVKLPGQIANGHLNAGPGTISLNLLFGLEPTQITLHHAVVDTLVDGPVNAPLMSQNGRTPGHLASENLSPTLTSFSSSSTGAMCSDVSAASFFDKSMPQLVLDLFGCANPDGTLAYTTSNRLLDLFVGGCTIVDTSPDPMPNIPVVIPTQPDGSLDGATYKFIINDSSNTVTSCTRNGAPATLQDCLSQATYSSYFKLKSDRVIIKRN